MKKCVKPFDRLDAGRGFERAGDVDDVGLKRERLHEVFSEMLPARIAL